MIAIWDMLDDVAARTGWATRWDSRTRCIVAEHRGVAVSGRTPDEVVDQVRELEAGRAALQVHRAMIHPRQWRELAGHQ